MERANLPRAELFQTGVMALTVRSSSPANSVAAAWNAPSLHVSSTPPGTNFACVFSEVEDGKGIKRGPMPSATHSEHRDAKTSSAFAMEHLKICSIHPCDDGCDDSSFDILTATRLYVQWDKSVNAFVCGRARVRRVIGCGIRRMAARCLHVLVVISLASRLESRGCA